MPEYESLNHSVWECKYHIVWIPKCRRAAAAVIVPKKNRIPKNPLDNTAFIP